MTMKISMIMIMVIIKLTKKDKLCNTGLKELT